MKAPMLTFLGATGTVTGSRFVAAVYVPPLQELLRTQTPSLTPSLSSWDLRWCRAWCWWWSGR